MAIVKYACGSTYVRVAAEADTDVTVQATGTAGLRVTSGIDGSAPDPDTDGFLIVYGNVITRSDISEGAIYAKSALENRASEATAETV
jgi:hypothetical protein